MFRESSIGKPYASTTHGDRVRLKRWLHQKRFADALRLLNPRPGDHILDYGCGDGYFLRKLAVQYPSSRLVGYDPAPNMFAEAQKELAGTAVLLVKDRQSLPEAPFSKITLLETAEHLPDDLLDETLGFLHSRLTPDGILLVSIPIEVGLPAILKNAYRAVRRRHYERLTAGNFFRAIVGAPFPRKVNIIGDGHRYIHSHMGFAHRRFEKTLGRYFTIIKRRATPVPIWGAFFNTSLYYLCRPRTDLE